jgi:hypothetical protein
VQKDEFIKYYIKKNIPTIAEVASDFDVSFDIVREYKKRYSNELYNINKVRKKFSKEREAGFNSFENFYKWYIEKEQKCAYCEISQDSLYILFNKENRILPLVNNNKVRIKRGSGTLEIERLDSSKKYSKDNCILACPLCNNAKSNLIDEKSWRDLFVPQMKKYYRKLLNK